MEGGGEGKEWRDTEKGEGLETYKQNKTEGKKILNTFKKNKYLGHLQSIGSRFASKPTDQQHPHILHPEVRDWDTPGSSLYLPPPPSCPVSTWKKLGSPASSPPYPRLS